MRVLVTGASGFICGYLVQELLDAGYVVVGVDNHSKYGPVARSYDTHPRYRFVEGDAKDVGLMRSLIEGCDQVVAAAAMIGGISYFHRFAYELLAENERILAATFDAAIDAHRHGRLCTNHRPQLVDGLRVGDDLPDPRGRTAHEPAPDFDLRLPEARERVLRARCARAVRPAVHDPAAIQLCRHRRAASGPRLGCHERQHQARAQPRRSGPRDESAARPGPAAPARRRASGPPLHVRRRSCAWHPSRDGIRRGDRRGLQPLDGQKHNDLDLAGLVWRKIHGPDRPFRVVHDPPFEHDVRLRVPEVAKARRVLGFEAETDLDTMLDEVIPWIRSELATQPA